MTRPRILVGVDFSADTAATLGRAAQVARRCSGSLHLLHVVGREELDPLVDEPALLPRVEERLIADAMLRLEELVQAFCQGIRVEVEAAVGQVRERVLAAAREADLVVLGARGTNPVRSLFIGSTADRLLRAAPCPVLVVKGAPAAPYASVVVPIEGPDDAARTIGAAARWAPDASVVAVHAMRVPLESTLRLAGADDAAIERVRARARHDAASRFSNVEPPATEPGRWRLAVVEGDPTPVILGEAAAARADLIAIGKQARRPWVEFLIGSVTRRVLATAECDVLVVPPAAKRD